MTINPQLQAAATYGAIHLSIGSIDVAAFEHPAAVGDTLVHRLQRLAKLYAGVKPLLEAVSALPLIPPAWRAGLALFLAALDAVAACPEVDPDFKAGKDL